MKTIIVLLGSALLFAFTSTFSWDENTNQRELIPENLFSALASDLSSSTANDKFPDTIYSNASKVDFDQYMELAAKVQKHRASRLVSFERFQWMAQDSNTVILDTRSKEMYDKQHIKGAIHLNFSDFNVVSLSDLIPNVNTRILIYCNNNFDYTETKIPVRDQFFISKSIRFEPDIKPTALLFLDPSSPKKIELTMALNVPTYINLYGYGYKNVYELADLISIYYKGIEFEGTDVVGFQVL